MALVKPCDKAGSWICSGFAEQWGRSGTAGYMRTNGIADIRMPRCQRPGTTQISPFPRDGANVRIWQELPTERHEAAGLQPPTLRTFVATADQTRLRKLITLLQNLR